MGAIQIQAIPQIKNIGRDVKAPVDAELYAIAPGVVYDISSKGWKGETVGDKNVGVIITHHLSDGSDFLASYGHVVTGLKKDDSVEAGQIIAKVGPYDYKDDKGNLRNAPHLHFGVHPVSDCAGCGQADTKFIHFNTIPARSNKMTQLVNDYHAAKSKDEDCQRKYVHVFFLLATLYRQFPGCFEMAGYF